MFVRCTVYETQQPLYYLDGFQMNGFIVYKGGVRFEIWALLSYRASFDLSNLGGRMENLKF